MQSIHRKITLAFSLLALLMAALALFAFLDMLFLENRVHQGVVVANLEYAIMEMRLQEKNLFLYRDNTAAAEADTQASRAMELLDREAAIFRQLDEAALFDRLGNSLRQYRQLLGAYTAGDSAQAVQEGEIRRHGHAIGEIANGLILRERRALAQSVSASQWALALSISILAGLVIILGERLGRRVVAPLRRLPEDLKPIAEGRFQHLISHSDEEEMVAFTNAFNRMLDELESRRRRLVQSEKLAALGVLVAGVAHELNNPLSNISSSCQLLLEEIDSAGPVQLAEWAATIDGETERARQIVMALMDYGRRRETEFVPVPLTELLRSTLLLLKGPLRQSGGRVELDIPAGLTLRADPQRLQQVFINLLRNAAESGESVTVSVTATTCGEAMPPLPEGAEVVGEPDCQLHHHTRMTQVMIADNGRGIPAEELSHVFEPFYSRREAGQGMGLGLYLVQEIIQEHDGCIAICSTPQQGTRIFLRLPCEGGAA